MEIHTYVHVYDLTCRRIDGRCIAVKGYLLLLRKVEILDEALLSSQNSQPVSGSQVCAWEMM